METQIAIAYLDFVQRHKLAVGAIDSVLEEHLWKLGAAADRRVLVENICLCLGTQQQLHHGETHRRQRHKRLVRSGCVGRRRRGDDHHTTTPLEEVETNRKCQYIFIPKKSKRFVREWESPVG